eukprot:scaffold5669_cov144-Skeletonema_menzelii.AAC.7
MLIRRRRTPVRILFRVMIHPPAADAATVDVDEKIVDTDQNNDFNPDEDEKLFLATGYRYSFAHERGFPYPWCAKKHGRKGWVVRNCPPVTYDVGIDTSHSTTRSVEFKGWKEAEKVLHSRQILMDRFGRQEISFRGNQGGAVATAKKAIDRWFQQTPIAMKNQRTANQEVVELAIEKKRKREEIELRKQQREELREMKAKEKIEREKQKIHEKQLQCHQHVAVENANNNSGALNDGFSGSPETSPRRKQSELMAASSPPRSKRKGNPKRDNKYREIERSFIENQTLLLSPAKYIHDHEPNSLLSSSTPTRMTEANYVSNAVPYSPIKTKYKRTQPRKNQHNSQSSSIILGEDPLMDQMIEDIVKEFTTEGASGQGHIFDGGAVSALREAALDMVVHNRGEKNENGVASAGSFAAHNPQGQILDLDDNRMEMMIEQLIGEVADDSGCNFEVDAVEALKMAAREIVTSDGDDAPVTTQEKSTNEDAVVKNGEVKTAEKEAGTSPTKNESYHDIQPLQLDNEDSNMSDIGGMIAQLVDDLGKESDIQFDSSAVEALKRASRLL